jgi:hypothetical protein
MKLKRLSKAQLKKYYAEQMLLEPVASQSEPHSIHRCCKCDSAKLQFDVTSDGELYYKCECGFESEPLSKDKKDF